jgi:hypothetical protein
MWVEWKRNPFGERDLYLKDCGANGDCQFLVVAEAIRHWVRHPHEWTARRIRQLAAKQALQMSRDEFDVIMSSYREEVKHGEFAGNWDPFKCTRREHLKAAIESPLKTGDGYDFQGDHTTLQLISKALKINIRVRCYDAAYTFTCGPSFPYTICLLYRSTDKFKHYQLLGQRHHSRIYTIFKTLPDPHEKTSEQIIKKQKDD